MEIVIKKMLGNSAAPMDLLLEADPSEQNIKQYLKKGTVFLAELEKNIAGVMVLMPISPASMEIMNLAVDEKFRGKGIAKKLIAHAKQACADQNMDFLEIGTGNSSLDQLALYQKCGFRMKKVIENYFIVHYPEPIFENGIQCMDMVRLKMKIKKDS
ncbi:MULTISPECIES: GNAT family N-acetyltransferase [Metabacillus]|uniref:GNAT family N-acetyltransferase n=1 Tax=Metabacillus hrfriensis TaxID=3048891 RepID=A0ACD4RGL0_9BACI|nr:MULTISPECIES: GNAT family N-acetyltransferase [Metabacillus]UAL53971.1 GNAT family N-acetyltransferase [Metabacillus dongyingensis]USK30287.1 GNAT family N-acetyltransferase [Bacillus sp. CMF21]WHZ59536.1 GNAT family N-acetyltransferase [Metabacillus sp. CT-WN-B3]